MSDQAKDRFWHTLPRPDRWALLDALVDGGLLAYNDGALIVTPLGEQYIVATLQKEREITSAKLSVEQEPQS